MKIKLGDKVKDKITGFEGIVIARIEYLNGCIQYGVKARVKEAALKEAEYIDEGQIERLGPGINKPEPKPTKEKEPRKTGGFQPDAPKKTRSYYAARRHW